MKHIIVAGLLTAIFSCNAAIIRLTNSLTEPVGFFYNNDLPPLIINGNQHASRLLLAGSTIIAYQIDQLPKVELTTPLTGGTYRLRESKNRGILLEALYTIKNTPPNFNFVNPVLLIRYTPYLTFSKIAPGEKFEFWMPYNEPAIVHYTSPDQQKNLLKKRDPIKVILPYPGIFYTIKNSLGNPEITSPLKQPIEHAPAHYANITLKNKLGNIIYIRQKADQSGYGVEENPQESILFSLEKSDQPLSFRISKTKYFFNLPVFIAGSYQIEQVTDDKDPLIITKAANDLNIWRSGGLDIFTLRGAVKALYTIINNAPEPVTLKTSSEETTIQPHKSKEIWLPYPIKNKITITYQGTSKKISMQLPASYTYDGKSLKLAP